MIRRKFISNLSISALALLANGSVARAASFGAQQKTLFRFAVTSDGHYGEKNTPFDDHFNTMVGAVNTFHQSNPLSCCVVNGDIIHDDPAMLPAAVDKLQQLKPRLFVTKGNHDRVSANTWQQAWKMPVNHDEIMGDNVLLFGVTANEKGEYLCPDQDWFEQKMKDHRDAKNIFIFLHITPVKWTTHAVHCDPFAKLVKSAPNIRAIFNGHDHDQDGIKFLGNTPFLFDGHFGGSWGTPYRGFRVVELREDNSLLTYMMSPTEKMPAIDIYRRD